MQRGNVKRILPLPSFQTSFCTCDALPNEGKSSEPLKTHKHLAGTAVATTFTPVANRVCNLLEWLNMLFSSHNFQSGPYVSIRQKMSWNDLVHQTEQFNSVWYVILKLRCQGTWHKRGEMQKENITDFVKSVVKSWSVRMSCRKWYFSSWSLFYSICLEHAHSKWC